MPFLQGRWLCIYYSKVKLNRHTFNSLIKVQQGVQKPLNPT